MRHVNTFDELVKLISGGNCFVKKNEKFQISFGELVITGERCDETVGDIEWPDPIIIKTDVIEPFATTLLQQRKAFTILTNKNDRRRCVKWSLEPATKVAG
ncbi:MAG: hypothetical protein WC805_02655 [Patescibacteria group bacterium]|jgi:hypothetical protein